MLYDRVSMIGMLRNKEKEFFRFDEIKLIFVVRSWKWDTRERNLFSSFVFQNESVRILGEDDLFFLILLLLLFILFFI